MSFQNKPAHLTQAFANSGDKTDIPETTIVPAQASYNLGFPPITRLPVGSGGLPPYGEDFNGIFYKGGSVFDLYAQAGGTFQLNTDILSNGGYPKNATLVEDDGIYMSTVDNNVDNYKTTPSVIGSTWLKIQTTIKDKYLINGFVPTSGSNSDEETTITSGNAICEDGSTIIELTSTETDLNWATLLGSALANSTTYHLFRYLKNDDTMQWHLSTSLTPTISDIKSTKAYRRILSLKTDTSGDLIEFIGYKKESGVIEIKFSNGGVSEGNSIQSLTKATITLSSIPLGLPLEVNFILNRINSASSNQFYILFNPSIDPAVSVNSNDIADGIGGVGGGAYDNGNGGIYKVVNTLSQISHKGTTSGNINLSTISYKDYRCYY